MGGQRERRPEATAGSEAEAPRPRSPGKQTRASEAIAAGSAGSASTGPAAPSTRGAPWEPDDSFLRAAGLWEAPAHPSQPAPAAPRAGGSQAPSPRRPAATKVAAPSSRKLAALVDELRELADATLQRRRAEAQAQVSRPRLDEAERERATREHDAVELVCAERGLGMRSEPEESAFLETEGAMAVRLPERRPQMRAFLERQITTHGSYAEGRRQIVMLLNSELTHASFATRQLGREQLAILDAEVAQFRTAFARQAVQTARGMLDDGSRAIAAALVTYGLPVDTVRLTAAAEKAGSGDSAGASADWLALAHAGENGERFADQAPQRQALATAVDRLQRQQAQIARLAQEQDRLLAMRARREHPSHQGASGAPPRYDLRAADGMDEDRRAAARSRGQTARLPPQLVTSPVELPAEAGSAEARLVAIGASLREARLGLSSAWIEAERRHPILAAYRRGGSPDPEAARALGSGSGAPGDEQMRAVLQQVMPKLANILRAKAALASGELSALTLPPVIELARTQMLVPEGSARAGAVMDLVEEASRGGWQAWAIAAVTLATTVLALVPTAGTSVILATNLSALALDVYVAVESYEEFGLQSALTNTDLDQARSLSAEEPSLTGLAVKLVSLGLNTGVVVSLFREAAKVHRLAASGKMSDDAARALDRLGAPYGLPHLGQDVAAEARAAEGTGRRAAKGAEAATVSVEGMAHSPRLTWRQNPDGVVRTPAEAVELAKKWGVEIDDDIVFLARDPSYFAKNTMAQYFQAKGLPGARMSWKSFLDIHEQLRVNFSRELLSSDEAIVAVLAHEMHEINGLRAIFDERETIPATEVFRLITPGTKGNLHDQAWDVADELVGRMRATRSGGGDP